MKIPRVVKTNISIDDYKKTLHADGYRYVGSGLYATVYSKKNSRFAIKIARMREDGYLDYLRLIDPSNPFFPKVYSVKCFSYRNADYPWDNYSYYVVKMERLVPFNTVNGEKRERIFEQIGLDDICQLDEFEINELHSYLKESKAKKPKLFQVIRTLKKLYRKSESDLHDGNVMWRVKRKGIPQLVITDPVV